jgi:hypothetical protein
MTEKGMAAADRNGELEVHRGALKRTPHCDRPLTIGSAPSSSTRCNRRDTVDNWYVSVISQSRSFDEGGADRRWFGAIHPDVSSAAFARAAACGVRPPPPRRRWIYSTGAHRL